ncbi:MAG: chemotaxis-specific methylesterase [Sphingobacteriaceae bacterium]|jgi:CheY-like chemotaxis protein|nr:chemotaxis-specific methylesterase [Sphingobacteriaceae bacterium]
MEDRSFIIVDDRELDCFVATKTIRQLGEKGSISTFVHPHKALEYISKSEAGGLEQTILLLDIIMPIMNGFQFVAEFNKLPEHIRNSYYVIAITSSMNKKYINMVNEFETIKGMIEKPITTAKFRDLLSNIGLSAPNSVKA